MMMSDPQMPELKMLSVDEFCNCIRDVVRQNIDKNKIIERQHKTLEILWATIKGTKTGRIYESRIRDCKELDEFKKQIKEQE